jgi:hypothetical protein
MANESEQLIVLHLFGRIAFMFVLEIKGKQLLIKNKI